MLKTALVVVWKKKKLTENVPPVNTDLIIWCSPHTSAFFFFHQVKQEGIELFRYYIWADFQNRKFVAKSKFGLFPTLAIFLCTALKSSIANVW